MKNIKNILFALLLCNITFTVSFACNLLSNNKVDIVLGSKSKIKVAAVKNIFSKYKVNICTTEANSGVNSQPVNEETFTGAMNRIQDAKNKYLLKSKKNNFIVIAIENGIFNEEKTMPRIWLDKAIIAIETADGRKYQDTTSTIAYPNEYVSIAKEKGFENTTVGKVMAELKFIKQHDDPHSSLSTKSRQQYLEETLIRLANILEQEKIIELKK